MLILVFVDKLMLPELEISSFKQKEDKEEDLKSDFLLITTLFTNKNQFKKCTPRRIDDELLDYSPTTLTMLAAIASEHSFQLKHEVKKRSEWKKRKSRNNEAIYFSKDRGWVRI